MWIWIGLGALVLLSRRPMAMAKANGVAPASPSSNGTNGQWRQQAPVQTKVSGGGTGITDPMTAFWLKVFGRDWRLDQPNIVTYGTTASTPIRGGTPAAPSGEYAYVAGAPSSPGDWRNPLTALPPMLGLDDPSLLYEPMPWFESPEGEYLYVADTMI